MKDVENDWVRLKSEGLGPLVTTSRSRNVFKFRFPGSPVTLRAGPGPDHSSHQPRCQYGVLLVFLPSFSNGPMMASLSQLPRTHLSPWHPLHGCARCSPGPKLLPPCEHKLGGSSGRQPRELCMETECYLAAF